MKQILFFVLLFFQLYSFGQLTKYVDWANLKKYEQQNTQIKQQTMDQKIVLMGNSITEFWSHSDSTFLVRNHYINRGISGQTTPQMLLRFRQDVVELHPSMVVILAGINDIAENTGPISLEQTFGNIASMAEIAVANKIKVVLCSVLPAYDFPWRRGMNPAPKVIQLNAMLKVYAEKNNMVYVDYFSAMVDERGGLDKKYTNDEVHPTLVGYQVMEPLLKAGIQLAFEK
jgi:lysophospholipase L1-like esterase